MTNQSPTGYETLYCTSIYTDGGCSPNPGQGAYVGILQHGDKTRCVRGYASHATNQQMELAAVITALYALKSTKYPVHIHTDSQYVCDGASMWLKSWKKNDWRTSGGSKIKNLDLWLALDDVMARFVITWFKVEGHAGVEFNVKADNLVTDTRQAKGNPVLYQMTDIPSLESTWNFISFQASQNQTVRPEVAYLRQRYAGILKGNVP
jgi:ribonuclease HI